MLNMLDDYIKHIKDTNNNSLLARIYGIFTFKTCTLLPINIIIMQNTSMIRNINNANFEFDLKGSLKGRHAPYNFYNKNIKHERNKTLKDLNFLEIQKKD